METVVHLTTNLIGGTRGTATGNGAAESVDHGIVSASFLLASW